MVGSIFIPYTLLKLAKTKTDKDRVLQIFKLAFEDSPGITWITAGNRRKQEILLSYFIDIAQSKNGAYLTSDKNGAVLFFSIEDKRTSLIVILKKMYLVFFVIGIRKSLQSIQYNKLIASIRPKKGLLGWFVATDQSVDGTKAAYEIKNEMFKISDKRKEPIFVETTVERVRLLYLRAGYLQYQSIKHPFEDLEIYFMKREPTS